MESDELLIVAQG